MKNEIRQVVQFCNLRIIISQKLKFYPSPLSEHSLLGEVIDTKGKVLKRTKEKKVKAKVMPNYELMDFILPFSSYHFSLMKIIILGP
jgi:hypothetical protein